MAQTLDAFMGELPSDVDRFEQAYRVRVVE